MIKDQVSAVDASCPDIPPVVPTRIKVLVLVQIDFFEVVRQWLRQLNLQLLEG
jgi:hypothetical protein